MLHTLSLNALVFVCGRMSKERRSKTAAKAASKEVSRKRRESQFKLALHVTFSAKKNPNVDPKPVSNPFIVSKVYNARTSLETILEDLDNVVSLGTDLRKIILSLMKCME